MRITILSRSSAIYTTRRLVDAARIAGHSVRVVDPLCCDMYFDGKSAKLQLKKKPLAKTDACIPRIGQSIQSYGLAVLGHLAGEGLPILNCASAIAKSREKLSCLQLLWAGGIPVPPTAVVANGKRDIKQALKSLGGCPVLVRMLVGGERKRVMVCETAQSTEAALEALQGLGHSMLVQQYVKGRDLRAVVVGGRTLAIVRRLPMAGRLRRTLGSGAHFEAVNDRPDLEKLAEQTANLVGLEVAAVDLFDSKDGPMVFEVNCSPGIREIEAATGVDIAAAMVDRAACMALENRKRSK